jgi:hypothetical protein
MTSAEDFDMRISQSARLGGLEKAMLLLWRSDMSGPIMRMNDPVSITRDRQATSWTSKPGLSTTGSIRNDVVARDNFTEASRNLRSDLQLARTEKRAERDG